MSEWASLQLGALVDFRKGVKVDVYDSETAGTLPYLGAAALDTGSATLFARTERAVVASSNDVLMLWDGERSGLVGGRQHGVVASTVARLRPRGAVTPGFLLHALQLQFGWVQARRTGTGVPHVPKDLGTWLTLDYPQDKNEQAAISSIIDDLDSQIVATRQIIDKLVLQGEGLASALLDVGAPCPDGWTQAALEEVTAEPITYGIVQAGPHVPDGVPYVRTGDMSGDDLHVDQMLRTSRRIASNYKRSTVRSGELICAIRATVGKVLPVPPELDGGNLTQGTARIAPGLAVDSRFLLWELRGRRVQDQIALAVKGTTFSEITLAALRQIPIAFPPIVQQRRLAATLDAHDTRIREERRVEMSLVRLKHGLATDLLTGHVRVPAEAIG